MLAYEQLETQQSDQVVQLVGGQQLAVCLAWHIISPQLPAIVGWSVIPRTVNQTNDFCSVRRTDRLIERSPQRKPPNVQHKRIYGLGAGGKWKWSHRDS